MQMFGHPAALLERRRPRRRREERAGVGPADFSGSEGCGVAAEADRSGDLLVAQAAPLSRSMTDGRRATHDPANPTIRRFEAEADHEAHPRAPRGAPRTGRREAPEADQARAPARL